MNDARQRKDNQRLMLKLTGFALGSFAFGFALVPFYDVLCEITGFGNQKSLAEAREALARVSPTHDFDARSGGANPEIPSPQSAGTQRKTTDE